MADEENKKDNKNEVGQDLIWGKDASVQGSGSVKSVNNRVYYYTGVSHASILDLTEQVQTVTKKMRVIGVENEVDPPPVTLHIGSYGGSVFAGFAGADMIKSNPLPVCTVVDGAAASAATMLSVVGQRRLIRKNAYMLIHQLSSVMYGKFEELKDEMMNLEKLMQTIKQIYIDHARIPRDKLDEMLKHDWWLTAEECLKYGLADEIIE